MEQQNYIGIIGNHLSHTLSPTLYRAAFSSLNIPYKYGVLDVSPKFLPQLIHSLRTLEFRGANVTIPYKKLVIQYMDEVSDEIHLIGAVNTIINNKGKLIGFNTDYYGVTYALQKYSNELNNNLITIFGAGGAARAVLFSLVKDFAPKKICIVNRTLEQAQQLVREFAKKFPSVDFYCPINEKDIVSVTQTAKLLINTTSLGMYPQTTATPLPVGIALNSNQLVFDIVYKPVRTLLLQTAEKNGATKIYGFEMLLGQGMKAFELFTHQAFPIGIAKEVLLHSLAQE